MRSAAVLAVGLLLAGCSSFHWQPCERAALAGELADVVSTAVALQTPGAHELNPLVMRGGDAEVIASLVLVKLGVHTLLHSAIERRAARAGETVGRNPRAVCAQWTAYGLLNAAAAAVNASRSKPESSAP